MKVLENTIASLHLNQTDLLVLIQNFVGNTTYLQMTIAKKQKCLAIRIPGGTLGGIWYDENNIIRKIVVDTKYVVKTYPSDVNEQLKKFVGEKLEFDEVKRNEENS